MAAPVKATLKQVKPLLSLNPTDARRKALTLYKAWYRQIPYVSMYLKHFITSPLK